MTERDNFILGWARLKRTSETGHKTDPSKDKPPGSAQAGVAGAEVTVAQPRIDVAADEPLDLASLPSIKAITARGFLQSRVPAELTRPALRQAWSRDPAIRDGIAECQWDFNDPNGYRLRCAAGGRQHAGCFRAGTGQGRRTPWDDHGNTIRGAVASRNEITSGPLSIRVSSKRLRIRHQPMMAFAVYRTMLAGKIRRPRTIVSPRPMVPHEITVRTAAPHRGGDQMQKSRSHIFSEPRVDEIDRARAQGYALLATLFSRSPDT
jgi:hypothetical protein